jgi:hypothetical protein
VPRVQESAVRVESIAASTAACADGPCKSWASERGLPVPDAGQDSGGGKRALPGPRRHAQTAWSPLAYSSGSAGIECGDLSSLLFLGWSVSFTGLRGKLISVICSNLINKVYNNSKTNKKYNYIWRIGRCIGRSVFFRPTNHKT